MIIDDRRACIRTDSIWKMHWQGRLKAVKAAALKGSRLSSMNFTRLLDTCYFMSPMGKRTLAWPVLTRADREETQDDWEATSGPSLSTRR
jgi:hypothetical protein